MYNLKLHVDTEGFHKSPRIDICKLDVMVDIYTLSIILRRIRACGILTSSEERDREIYAELSKVLDMMDEELAVLLKPV